MSSTYHLICMSHTPPLVESGEIGLDQAMLIAASAHGERSEPAAASLLGKHQTCDVLIGRWSGALVELGCAGQRGPGCYHNGVSWVETEWLRLAAHVSQLAIDESAATEFERAVVAAMKRLPSCWPLSRLLKLAFLLKTQGPS